MQKAYVLYHRNDAIKNASFITALQHAFIPYGINLCLQIVEDIAAQHFNDALFVWNRSRNATISKQLERQKIAVTNRSEVTRIANNKKETLTVASLLGIPTVPVIDEKHLKTTTYPVVIKTIDGHGGAEVQLCHDFETVQKWQQTYTQTIIEPYIETNATDVRVWMLGDQVIGAVKRIGAPGNFRSNYTMGGTVETFTLTKQQLQAVQRIQKALKSDYIGIDFLYLSDKELLLNEIEDPVGARSYYELYGNNLPSLLATYFYKKYGH